MMDRIDKYQEAVGGDWKVRYKDREERIQRESES